MEALTQQLDFLLELDKLKAIYRQALVRADNNRQENSAEHSWHIAMMAPILQEYCTEDIALVRVIKMLLIHDIVEIDAGDTFAFSDAGDLDAQHQKEVDAANRIFGLLPESQNQEYRSLWFEFEAAETADARFAKAMDRLLPLLQNMQNNGGSWARHGVKKSQVLKRNQYLEDIAPRLWQYVCAQIALAAEKGWLRDE